MLHEQCYTREALAMAAYEFTNQFTVTIDRTDGGYWLVRMHPQDVMTEDLRSSAGETYCQRALDHQVRYDLELRTGAIRQNIFEHAFAPARVSAGKKKRS